MHFQQYLPALSLAISAAAGLATPKTTFTKRSQRQAADIIRDIMPASSSCEGRGDECATADMAAPFFITAMDKYGLYGDGEIAAVLAISGFESEDLRYRRNLAHAGQGTANQQQYEYNLAFARSVPALAAKVANATGSEDDAGMNRVRDLLIVDEYNFATGAWFLAEQDRCKNARALLKDKPSDDAFTTFCLECVKAPEVAGRAPYWARAKKAFGIEA